MNERIHRQELEVLEGLVDVVFDPAEWVKAMEGPSRWLVISGRFPDAGQRIVLETSRPAPHFWWHPEWPHRDDDWIVPALILEIERPWLLEAWAEADPWFLAANYDAPVEEMVGRCFVDVAPPPSQVTHAECESL